MLLEPNCFFENYKYMLYITSLDCSHHLVTIITTLLSTNNIIYFITCYLFCFNIYFMLSK